eukprot:363754-Chlamydomonas_euryale.AAC.3
MVLPSFLIPPPRHLRASKRGHNPKPPHVLAYHRRSPMPHPAHRQCPPSVCARKPSMLYEHPLHEHPPLSPFRRKHQPHIVQSHPPASLPAHRHSLLSASLSPSRHARHVYIVLGTQDLHLRRRLDAVAPPYRHECCYGVVQSPAPA